MRMEQQLIAVASPVGAAQKAEVLNPDEMISVSAEVIGGARLGRTIGFPTANMALDDGVYLDAGIYAVEFIDVHGRRYGGVSSFGRRPTVVENGEMLLETHLLNFEGNLYGQSCTVRFVQYLRPEVRFSDIESMVDQIKADVAHAEAILARRGVICRQQIRSVDTR